MLQLTKARMNAQPLYYRAQLCIRRKVFEHPISCAVVEHSILVCVSMDICFGDGEVTALCFGVVKKKDPGTGTKMFMKIRKKPS